LESELVAGFMVEHTASVFVFFFLGEYSSLILMSAFMSVFFLGGHHCPDLHKLLFDPFIYLFIYFESAIVPLSFYRFVESYQELAVSHSFDDFANMELEYVVNTRWLYDMNEHIGKEYVLDSINILIDKLYGSYVLGFKIVTVVFFFIWVRASFPRLRYDQLMSLCWKELLPLVFAYIIFTICLFFTFDMMPFGTSF